MLGKKRMVPVLLALISGFSAASVLASPEEDLVEFQNYFKKRFPDVKFQDFGNGIYALDKSRRETWEEMESFIPAYNDAVVFGEKLFNTPFANGKTYASCFKNKGIGIKNLYPYYNRKQGRVKTMEMEINECRRSNGEKPLKYKKGKMAAISAYMAYTSRGKPIKMSIPNDDKALAAYTRGKNHFYRKRGQMNFSCADCHVYNSGMNIRTDLLSPALGQVTHFPVWRLKWAAGKSDITSGLGTLHRRYGGCNKNIRAKPFKAQSDEYVALEYFHTYMNKGLNLNGPAIRQ